LRLASDQRFRGFGDRSAPGENFNALPHTPAVSRFLSDKRRRVAGCQLNARAPQGVPRGLVTFSAPIVPRKSSFMIFAAPGFALKIEPLFLDFA
jgi:hypothetical protein